MTDTSWDPNNHPITFINTVEQLPVLRAAIARAERVSVDTETHDASCFEDGLWSALRIVAVALRHSDGSYEAFVVDARDVLPADLAPVLATIEVADAWNANFDDRVLELAGCPVPAWRDAMHSDGLLHSGVTGFEFWHGLAHAAKKYLGLELSGKGTTQTSYDGISDLSEEQVRYPGFDALITLRVAEHIDALVDAAGLTTAVALEHASRPFILEMTKRGLPFQMERWRAEVLAEHEIGIADARRELASLTGSGDIGLFGESEEPSWNPDSDAQAREALNTWAEDAVKAFTGGRLLTKVDKLDKTSLKQIKHPIAAALLRYRNHAKLLSTYGENLDGHIGPDGRIRPRYKQGGVVATGRLASDKPNAQNFSPLMKAYFRPNDEVLDDGTVIPRAFVYADLSQAELRVLAEVSGEERMRELFRLGGDFHARTAADMFGVDMDSLKDSDPTAHSNNRKKAKGVNFGIPYGLGARALGQNLTVNSKLQTSTEEAAEMLKRYAEAYPAVDKWLSARDRFVKDTARTPGQVDWKLSFELYDLFNAGAPVAKAFKRKNKRPMTMEELSHEILSDDVLRSRLGIEGEGDVTEARAEHVTALTWALSFDAPVVLRPGGQPWTFESRTLTGRRRLFTVPMDSSTKDKFEGVVTSAMLTICTSDKPTVAEIRAAFAEEHGLDLPVGINRCPKQQGESPAAFKARSFRHRLDERSRCVKAFEGTNKKLKYELLKTVLEKMGAEAVYGYLLPMALGDQVRSMGNRFRNHPIQSLVADVGLQYYADLHGRLKKYRNAFPVQAVHDSIAIECDLADAPILVAEVKAALENALSHWCPNVPAVADADIRLSLADEDVIDVAKVTELLQGTSPVPA
jgi:DNA polymerase I-like protein with 3'-5' exonuclease and polymerase domains